ncbi:MAG TPA: redoxin domain-containing protein [Anaerolineae bacterium]|nr:redoxin domain-containing protein [Anaerolineae bacterium]
MYCRRRLAQLRRDYPKFVERDAEVIVVGPDGPRAFETYWRKEKLPFAGLPDPKMHVLNLYGQEVNLLKLGRMPAQIMIDKAGRVRYAHYSRSMRDIPANAELLQLLDRLNRIDAREARPPQEQDVTREQGRDRAGADQSITRRAPNGAEC